MKNSVFVRTYEMYVEKNITSTYYGSIKKTSFECVIKSMYVRKYVHIRLIEWYAIVLEFLWAFVKFVIYFWIALGLKVGMIYTKMREVPITWLMVLKNYSLIKVERIHKENGALPNIDIICSLRLKLWIKYQEINKNEAKVRYCYDFWFFKFFTIV